jgi:hypothetical protein
MECVVERWVAVYSSLAAVDCLEYVAFLLRGRKQGSPAAETYAHAPTEHQDRDF